MKRFAFLPILFALFAASCTKHIYVPVESVKRDSIYFNYIKLDSIYMRDSIYVEVKGDTVREFNNRYIYKWRNRIDTTYIMKRDSIQVPFPVEVVKEVTSSWVWWMLGFLALFAIPSAWKLIKWIKGLRFFDLY